VNEPEVVVRTCTEWGVRTREGRVDGYDDREEAEAMLRWLGGHVVRRTVTYGPWEVAE
jgi:hypothetical protein